MQMNRRFFLHKGAIAIAGTAASPRQHDGGSGDVGADAHGLEEAVWI